MGEILRYTKTAIYHNKLNALKVIILTLAWIAITVIVRNAFKYQKIPLASKVGRESFLKRYDPVASQLSEYNRCKFIMNLKPSYLVCHHPIKEDQYISKFVSMGRAWEGDLSHCLKVLLDRLRHQGAAAIFVDVGANIGVHSLYLAASGYDVLAVEPVAKNLNLMYESARRQGTLGKIRMYQNAVSDSREFLTIHIDSKNAGGSHVQDIKGKNMTKNVRAVLLQDVFDEVQTNSADQSESVTLIVKMDIETFECKAIVGSPHLFETSSIFAAVFFMEWHFLAGGKLHKNCQLPVMKQVAEMFHAHGYHPYKHLPGRTQFEKLNCQEIETWPHMDLAWFHESIHFSKSIFKL